MINIAVDETQLDDLSQPVSPTPPTAESGSPLRVLFNGRNFRLLWLGEAISLLGDQFYLIALPWLVLQLTGDALIMGTVLAIEGLPRAIFMLVGGALTDRFSARSVMLATNLARMVLVALLAVFILIGFTHILILYAFALLFGLADAFFFPAQSAIVPYIVNKKHLQMANAIIQGTAQLSLFAGPVLAGVLIAVLSGGQTAEASPDMQGIGIAFGIDALTFLASALTLWLMRVNVSGVEDDDTRQEESVLSSIREGLLVAWRDPLLRSLFFMIGIANVFINASLIVGIPVLADMRLPEGAAAFGILMSAFGGGSLMGTLLGGFLPRPPLHRLGTVLLVIWSIMGIGVAVLGFVSQTAQGALVTGIVGMANGYVVIIFITWLQERTPEALLGRMMSLLMFTLAGLAPVGNAIAGGLVDLHPTAFFVGSGSFMAIIVLAHLTSPRMRSMGALTIEEATAGQA